MSKHFLVMPHIVEAFDTDFGFVAYLERKKWPKENGLYDENGVLIADLNGRPIETRKDGDAPGGGQST